MAWHDGSDPDKAPCAVDRIGRYLDEGTVMQRWWALQSLEYLEGARQHFLPDLVRGITNPMLRDAVVPVLRAGGVDLGAGPRPPPEDAGAPVLASGFAPRVWPRTSCTSRRPSSSEP